MRRLTSSEFLYNWQLRSEADGYHSAELGSSADTVAWHVKVFSRTYPAEKRQPHRGEKRTDRATAGLVEEWQTSSSEKWKISAEARSCNQFSAKKKKSSKYYIF